MGDVWIYPPECDDEVITGDLFDEENELSGKYTIMWTDEEGDRWSRLEYDEINNLLTSLDNNGVILGDVWIYPPQCDDNAMDGDNFDFTDEDYDDEELEENSYYEEYV